MLCVWDMSIPLDPLYGICCSFSSSVPYMWILLTLFLVFVAVTKWCMHAGQLVCCVFHVKISFHSNGTKVPYSQALTVVLITTRSSRVESPRRMTDSPSACNGTFGPSLSRLSGSLLLASCYCFHLHLILITQSCWQE